VGLFWAGRSWRQRRSKILVAESGTLPRGLVAEASGSAGTGRDDHGRGRAGFYTYPARRPVAGPLPWAIQVGTMVAAE